MQTHCANGHMFLIHGSGSLEGNMKAPGGLPVRTTGSCWEANKEDRGGYDLKASKCDK